MNPCNNFQNLSSFSANFTTQKIFTIKHVTFTVTDLRQLKLVYIRFLFCRT